MSTRNIRLLAAHAGWKAVPVIIAAVAVVVTVTFFATRQIGGGGDASDAVAPSRLQTAESLRARFTPDVIRAMGFDTLPEVPEPLDNPTSFAKVDLGKRLFFDPRLSANSSISCASCHQPALGWGDGLDLNFGYAGTPHWRNSQTVINAVYHPKLTWAGEARDLEEQARKALTGATAHNIDPTLAEERIRQIPVYHFLFIKAFGSPAPSFDNIARAIASFEATITSRNVPFDRYMEGDSDALSDAAIRGFALFAGDAGCSACHSGPLFTDQSYHALGVPESPKFKSDPLRQITLRYQFRARGVTEEDYRSAKADLGLYYTTKQDADRGKFRTPMLREVGQTGPYMHNGVLSTLEDVVQFYNEGGGDAPNKSTLLRRLNLTGEEVDDLVEFLLALTGDQIIVDPPELPEYTTFD